ncbi:phage portal protein, partial [Salmonella enterica subsp. enterica serovar Panama]
GEVFTQVLTGKISGLSPVAGVPFWLEALEPDYIPLEKTDNSSNLVQGIYFNEWRRPVKYLVCQSWPGAGAAAVAVKEVTAENMLHLRFTRRLNQARGASLLAPVIIRLMDLKEYEDSERIAARIAASLGMFIKKQDVGTDGYVAPEKRKETQIQPGML